MDYIIYEYNLYSFVADLFDRFRVLYLDSSWQSLIVATCEFGTGMQKSQLSPRYSKSNATSRRIPSYVLGS